MSLNEFKKLNAAKGFFWFSENTMRFFSTKIHDYDNDSGLFITSELPPFGGKKYSLREANFNTGNVKTIGQFGAYDSLKDAKNAMALLLMGSL